MNFGPFTITFLETPDRWSFVLAVLAFALLFPGASSRRLPFLFRGIAIALLLLALLSPHITTTSYRSTAKLLLDVSESVEPAVADRLLAELKKYQSDALQIAVIPFAGSASDSARSLGSTDYDDYRRQYEKLNIGSSNLESAISSISANDSVLLLSDGYETIGSIKARLADNPELMPKIYPLIPKENREADGTFRITKLHAPLVAPAQKSVDIRVSVSNTTSQTQRGKLTVKHNEKTVLEQEVAVEPGREELIIALSDPSVEGIKKIVASLQPQTSTQAPSLATRFISGEIREKILLLSGEREDQGPLAQSLRDQAYRLDSKTAGELGGALPQLKDYSVVIFNNIAYKQLPSGAATAVKSFVEQGGKFVMLGNKRSFGLGGYINTSIEDILPLELMPPQTEKKRLNVAVQLVLDKSKSMSSQDKIEWAKDAAREVIKNLKDDDYVGVTGFDDSAFPVVPLRILRDSRAQALDRIRFLVAAGVTNLLPAMRLAAQSLEGAKAGRKHMIVLTDGQLPDSAQGRSFYQSLIREMRTLGVTVSTVMLGNDGDPLLQEMADLGGGAYYKTSEASRLPKLFLDDIRVSTGEQTAKESEFVVRVGPSGTISTKIESFPPILGYVQTKPKPKASIELLAKGQSGADPLLASWSVGKGRSIAFTSDSNGLWSRYWVGWNKYQTFWSELIDSLRPDGGTGGKQEPIRFDLRYFLEGGSLQLDLTVFNEDVTGGIAGDIVLPNSQSVPVTFEPVSRGRYRAALPAATAGTYQLSLAAGQRPFTPVAFELSGELFGERKGLGFNVPLLEAIASASGGKSNPNLAELNQASSEVSQTPLTPYILVLALLMLLAEIVIRELGFVPRPRIAT